jgi:hypothetical protein
MAVLRYAVLMVPFGLGGMALGRPFGWPALFGLLLGLIAASTLASTFFYVWMARTLKALRPSAAAAAAGAAGAAVGSA